jgi:hypothetical protein
MGLDPRDLRARWLASPALDQRHLGPYGEPDRRRWGCGQALVPWERLIMRAPGQPDRSLDAAVDQPAHDRQPRHGRHPFRLLQPHGAAGCRVLAPANARCHGGVLLLIGRAKRRVCPGRRASRGGQHRPSLRRCRVAPRLDLDHEARARLRRGGVRLRWTAQARPPHAAGVGHDARAAGMRSPALGPPASPAWPPGLIRGDGRCGLRLTGKPPRLHLRAVGRDSFGFFGLCRALSLGLLRGPWARMPDHTAPGRMP